MLLWGWRCSYSFDRDLQILIPKKNLTNTRITEIFVQFNEGKKWKQKRKRKKKGNNKHLVSSFLERIENKQELKIIDFIFNKKKKHSRNGSRIFLQAFLWLLVEIKKGNKGITIFYSELLFSSVLFHINSRESWPPLSY